MVRRGRGSGRGGVGSGRDGLSRSSGGAANSERVTAAPQSHFSLSEEARNTERHHAWNSDLKLRHSRVAFVSAGTSSAEELTQAPQERKNNTSEATSDPLQEKANTDAEPFTEQLTTRITSPEIPMSKMTLNEFEPVQTSAHELGKKFGQNREAVSKGSQRGMDRQSASNELFFTDVNGLFKSVHTGLPPPRIQRSPSPAPSDSSEEIILFAGRHGAQVEAIKGQGSTTTPRKAPRQEAKIMPASAGATGRVVIDDPIDQGLQESTSKQKASPPQALSSTQERDTGYQPAIPSSREKTDTKKRRRGKCGPASWKAVEEAEILADYIANTRDSDDLNGFAEDSGLNRCDLGGSDAAEWQDEEASSTFEEQVEIAINDAEDWDSADLQDFDELSTSSEAPTAIARILSKRERPSGVQYLVVGEGFTVDDAHWLPLSALNVPGASEQIRDFEQEQADFDRLLDDSDELEKDSTKDEQLARDVQEQIDDIRDERDHDERRTVKMTDEQIARLLSKQEEIGLGSNDLVLFDGANLDADEELEMKLNGIPAATRQVAPRARRKPGLWGTQVSFPSATALAAVLDQDPYNGFDIMDQERPSLRKLPKGRRGKLPIELSDSELEQSLQMAWDNDRSKKKVRKQKREELRAQGLLGKKAKLDTKAKYSEGMSVEEVKEEIRNFLSSSLESLSLPPMAHEERKMVHEIANVFKMKSKSVGGGKSRFPVLYKTSRTTQYDEKALNALDPMIFLRRFLPRLHKGKKKSAVSGKTRGGGFASAGVSYRDGEIVGATAPELGQENRGRAMLEKMGWSTGKALGALNNDRGIVQPVAQVVKTTKAGLG